MLTAAGDRLVLPASGWLLALDTADAGVCINPLAEDVGDEASASDLFVFVSVGTFESSEGSRVTAALAAATSPETWQAGLAFENVVVDAPSMFIRLIHFVTSPRAVDCW